MTDEEYAELFMPELNFYKSEENIYRYRPINEKDLTAIREGYLWCSYFKDVNDPFDGTGNFQGKYYPDDFMQLVSRVGVHRFIPNRKLTENLTNTDGTSLEVEISQTIETFRKYYKMCCFSRVNDSVLMWSHYADSHKGMILEFDYRKDFKTFGQSYLIRYVSEFKKYNLLSGDPQSILQLICTKLDKWEYEHEIRIVNPVEGNKLYYSPISLIRVIFGCETTSENKVLVKESLKGYSHIKYAVCKKDMDKGSLLVINE